MNLRGQIISVVDLRKKLGIKQKQDSSEVSVVIVNFDDISIGLVVDSINRVLTVPASAIAVVPEIQSQVNSRLIKGVYRGNDKLVVQLDIEVALNIKEIKKLASVAA